MEKLCKMSIHLGTSHPTPLDTAINAITRLWAGLSKSTYKTQNKIVWLSYMANKRGWHLTESNYHLPRPSPRKGAMAQQVQAMNNTTIPMMMEKLFTKSMKDLADTLDEKLASLAHTINLNTDRQVEPSTEMLKAHATTIQSVMGSSVMALEYHQSSHHVQGTQITKYIFIHIRTQLYNHLMDSQLTSLEPFDVHVK